MIDSKELTTINGGFDAVIGYGISVTLIGIIIGIIDGYINPTSCNLCKKNHSQV